MIKDYIQNKKMHMGNLNVCLTETHLRSWLLLLSVTCCFGSMCHIRVITKRVLAVARKWMYSSILIAGK